MTTYEGELDAEGKRFAVVAARWHERFSDTLMEAAEATLRQHGADEEDVVRVRCPGSFELPQAATRVDEELDVDAIVCIGVLVRGETPHFDYIAGETTSGIGGLARESDRPVVYGVLTCETMEQAMARSGSKQGNKGREAALAAIEMASLYEQLEQS